MAKTMEAMAAPAKRGGGKDKPAREAQPRDVAFEALVDQERVAYTDVNAYAGTDLDIVASRIAVEVTFALSEQVEELNVYSSAFRMSIHRLARWILVSLLESPDRCVVVPDGLPGFTAMGFKRAAFDLDGAKVDLAPPSLERGSVEREAATMIMQNFMGRANAQVVVVECRDALLALFPVADTRANLKKLGFFARD